MYTHPQQGAKSSDVLKLRQEAGRYLKNLREAAGLSQRNLATAVKIDHYTFISQIESGRGRVPPGLMKDFAKHLRVDPKEFGTRLLSYYDPISYELIFGDVVPEPPSADRSAKDALEERIAKLEQLLNERS